MIQPSRTPTIQPSRTPTIQPSFHLSINHTAMIIGIVISCPVLFIAYIYIKQKKEKLSKYEFSEDDELMIDL
jgi:H+/gluconate symporter-like permease